MKCVIEGCPFETEHPDSYPELAAHGHAVHKMWLVTVDRKPTFVEHVGPHRKGER